MALFWVAIKRGSIFFLKFPLRSHVQLTLCAISLDCLLKYLYSCCFFSYFYFLDFIVLLFVFKSFMLILLLLASVISFSLLFVVSFNYDILASPLLLSFHDT